MKKLLLLALASATLVGCSSVSQSDTITISRNGDSVSVPAEQAHLYFEAGDDLLNGSQGFGDNRDWLIEQGADPETAKTFVNMVEAWID